MTERLDFTALYRELGLAPGCTPDHLRTAYRRRVSHLHPDQGGDAEDTGRLQRLNRLYRAALEFERDHGRLPGAGGGAGFEHGPERGPERAPRDAWPRAPAAPGATSTVGPMSADTRGGMPRAWWAVVAAAVCVLAWRVLIGMMASPDAAPEGEPGVARSAIAPRALVPSDAPAAQAAAERHDGLLLPGMGRETVLDIQGEPLDRNAQRWQYGPSWVEFACDRVATWYSSPLQPLRVRPDQPTATATEVCSP